MAPCRPASWPSVTSAPTYARQVLTAAAGKFAVHSPPHETPSISSKFCGVRLAHHDRHLRYCDHLQPSTRSPLGNRAGWPCLELFESVRDDHSGREFSDGRIGSGSLGSHGAERFGRAELVAGGYDAGGVMDRASVVTDLSESFS
jgi:hypothetical protein